MDEKRYDLCDVCGKDCFIDFRGRHLTGLARQEYEMETFGHRAAGRMLAAIAVLLLLIGVCLMVAV